LRVHVTSAGSDPATALHCQRFHDLAAMDVHGRHQLEPDAERADAIVFADVNLHRRTDPHGAPRADLFRRFPERCFSYEVGDVPMYTLPGVYVSARRQWLTRLPVLGGPYIRTVTQMPPASQEPSLLYSFRGSPSSRLRRRVLALNDPRAKIEAGQGPWDPGTAATEVAIGQVRHIDLIQRSKFVLCPRGQGPSSHRIFETLAAGRVPVIISDKWVPPPRLDWERGSVRVAERDIARIPEILAATEARWPELAAGASCLAHEFSDAHMWDHVMESIATVTARPRPARPPFSIRALVLTRRTWLAAGPLRARLRERLQAGI